MMLPGADIRKVREQLGEDQTVFGLRFGVHRRTIIRWEKAGHFFMYWGGYRRPDGKSEFDLWRATFALAESRAAKAAKKNSSLKSTTALATRKSRPARRSSVTKAKRIKRIKKPGRKK